jgi:hypothetical protein
LLFPFSSPIQTPSRSNKSTVDPSQTQTQIFHFNLANCSSTPFTVVKSDSFGFCTDVWFVFFLDLNSCRYLILHFTILSSLTLIASHLSSIPPYTCYPIEDDTQSQWIVRNNHNSSQCCHFQLTSPQSNQFNL